MNKPICGIYMITNLINQKKYIGQSNNIYRRWNEHINDDRKRNAYAIHAAIKKYGKDNFSFEILEECSIELLNEREEYWIAYYDTYNTGYNLTYGGDTNRKYDYQQIYDLWAQGHTCKEIKQIIGCNDKVITQVLRYFDISVEEALRRNNHNQSKPIVALDIKTNTPLKVFSSVREATLFFYNGKLNQSGSFLQSMHNHWSWAGYKWEYLTGTNVPQKELTDKEFLSYQREKIYTLTDEQKLEISLRNRYVERPSREELKKLIRTTPFTTIGKLFSISDNGIRKWCDYYNLPRKVSEIKKYSEEEWNNI